MNKYHLYLLLRFVNNNSSINLLRREGLNFETISNLLKLAIVEGYIEYSGDIAILTNEGRKKLAVLKAVYTLTNKDEWIEKEKSSEVSKIEINSIFLPDKNNLSF